MPDATPLRFYVTHELLLPCSLAHFVLLLHKLLISIANFTHKLYRSALNSLGIILLISLLNQQLLTF